MKQCLEEKVFEDRPNYDSSLLESSTINTVFVVPNRASKKMTYRKLKNHPNAEIIDASSFQTSSTILAQSSLPGPENFAKAAVQEINFFEKTDSILPGISQSHNKPSELCNVDIEGNCEVIFEQNSASHEINENEDLSSKATFLKEIEDSDNHQTVNASTNLKNLSSSMYGVCEKVPSTQEERLNEALKDVVDLKISVRRAAHIHGVKHSLLLSKINKNLQVSTSKGVLGADPALTEQEELQLVEWIRSRYKKGCPVKKIDLINRVAEIVSDGRTTRFKEGVPGEKWFNNFILRNPSVSTLGPAARLDSREVPSKRSIMSWFKRCSDHLKVFGKAHLLNDSRSVGHVEELTLCLVSTKASVSNKNLKCSEFFLPQESSGNVSVLIGACADGTLIPPMPVFSCRKPPTSLINSMNSGWGIGLSKYGSIDKEVVHSYFQNILIPWLLEQGRLPFILFIDKLKSFLSVDITDYCAQKGLLCYNFYPNSSSVIQPLHKSVFQSIKKSWNALSQHKSDKEALLRFCPKLNELLNEVATPHVIVKSFMSCGIFPFSPKAPDYRNCPLSVEGAGSCKSFRSCDYATALDVFEDMIGETKTEIFQETLKGFKLIKAEDKGLYKIWHRMISKVDVTRNQNPEIQVYRHEKIIRGSFRKLPRPETYLMVVDDNCSQDDNTEGYLSNFSIEEINIDNFDEEEEANESIQGNMKQEDREDVAFSHFLDVDDDDSSEQDDEKSSECLTSDNWKIRYLSEERDDSSKDSMRLKEERRRERLSRKQKRIESEVGLNDNMHKKLRNACHLRTCSACFLDIGKLIKCIMCKKHIHFECMKEEEQQILSDLYEDNVAFDYICPVCST